ncbi:uncharacterized protein [Ptychodera flava]|uniref:uncharacterized protein n=1 Tax=Ptychodera flava TaxID=63121 RepID=UPI003969BFB4
MEKSGKDSKEMFSDPPPPYSAYPSSSDVPPPPKYEPPQEEKKYPPGQYQPTGMPAPQFPGFFHHSFGHFGQPSLADLANNVTESANRLAAAAGAQAYMHAFNMTTVGMPGGMPSSGMSSNFTVIQLISPVTGGALRVLPDGRVDAKARPNEAAAQFIQLDQGNGVVVMRNAAKKDYHLEAVKGQLIGNGSGSDFNSQFRVHQGKKGMFLFESMSSPGFNIGVASDGSVNLSESSGNDTMFNVRVIASSSVQTNQPGSTFVVQQYNVK